MKNMYEEMSKGAYTVNGEASPWVEVPHSEAWYGASRCFLNDEDVWEAGAIQSMYGHPDNPDGPGALGTDAINALAAADPNFPWADYDIEDQGDIDGDGNVFEPDGIIDHLVLVHAGDDKSGGGGDEGVYAIWAHSSTIAGGYPIPAPTSGLELHRPARGLRRGRLRPRVRPRPRPAGPVRHGSGGSPQSTSGI